MLSAGLFRKRMPPSASAFLLTLATVDDLGAARWRRAGRATSRDSQDTIRPLLPGAILVLATCFASNVSLPFLAAAAAVTAGLAAFGRTGSSDLKAFAAGGAALWYCLLRAGINADIAGELVRRVGLANGVSPPTSSGVRAGVLAAFCISTRAQHTAPSGVSEALTHRAVVRLSPLSTFGIMPLFALANTAVPLGAPATGAAAAALAQASLAPAAGIGAGLLLGKPLGIFGASLLASRFGVASLPAGMSKRHVASSACGCLKPSSEIRGWEQASWHRWAARRRRLHDVLAPHRGCAAAPDARHAQTRGASLLACRFPRCRRLHARFASSLVKGVRRQVHTPAHGENHVGAPSPFSRTRPRLPDFGGVCDAAWFCGRGRAKTHGVYISIRFRCLLLI